MYAVNQLPLRDMARSKTGCCPPFDPAEWDGQIFEFKDKRFLKFTTRSLFHIPLNMSSKMKKEMAKVEKAGATSSDYLMLSDEVSPWKAEHLLAVTKEVPGENIVKLNGRFLAKVFEGDYREMGSWYEQLIQFVKDSGQTSDKTYFNYTVCPGCAKAYGKNYVVGFARLDTH